MPLRSKWNPDRRDHVVRPGFVPEARVTWQ